LPVEAATDFSRFDITAAGFIPRYKLHARSAVLQRRRPTGVGFAQLKLRTTRTGCPWKKYAFLLHPADMVVPPTRSSTDVFGLLNARREKIA